MFNGTLLYCDKQDQTSNHSSHKHDAKWEKIDIKDPTLQFHLYDIVGEAKL